MPIRILFPGVCCVLAGLMLGGCTTPSRTATRRLEPVASSKVSARSQSLIESALECVSRREYRKAAGQLSEARRVAVEEGDAKSSRLALFTLANVQVMFFQYRDAMRNYLACRAEAAQAGDRTVLSAVEFNLSNLYYTFSAYEDAEQALDRGLRLMPPRDAAQHRLKTLMQRARLRSRMGKPEQAERLYREAIGEAERQSEWQWLAQAYEHLGLLRLRAGDHAAAEHALLEAYRIRRLWKPERLASSFYQLGNLDLARKRPAGALRLFDHALDAARHSGTDFSTLHILHARSRALAAMGRYGEAWRESIEALRQLRDWRVEVLPGDSALSSAGVRLQEIYLHAIEAGAQLHAAANNDAYAAATLAIAEANRASALHALASLDERLDRALPDEYTEILAQLRAVEGGLLAHDSPEDRRRLEELRHRLSEIEVSGRLDGAAPALPPPGAGTSAFAAALQRRLGPDEALLSFLAGERYLYLWTVSRARVELHRLEDPRALEKLMNQWLEAMARAEPEAAALAAQVHARLLGKLGADVLSRKNWLLALDGFLFRLPFAALVEEYGGGRPRYLVESRSLRVLPAAGFLFEKPAEAWSGPLLGIYDPIYNAADERLRGSSGRQAPTAAGLRLDGAAKSAAAAPEVTDMPRLPGTRKEWEACSRMWLASGGSVAGLEGASAEWTEVLRALERKPAVLHFATHLAPSPAAPFHSVLALSRGVRTGIQFCSADQLRGVRLRSPLVVLSGCSSGAGQVDPGEGMRGLTRAWLMAGAGAVAASLWPAPDDPGALWQSFYRELRRNPQETRYRAEQALRQAQRDMIRLGGWQAQPRHWGAYYVVSRK